MNTRLGALIIFGIAATALPQSAKKTVFVSAEQLEVASVLLNPPAMDSAQTKSEIADLHQLEKTRTPEQVLRAQQDDAQEDIFIFQNVLGKNFNREALPATALLSDHVHGDEGTIVTPAKKFFRRPRPYFFDTTLKPVCKMKTDPTDYSYPSGHGTSGYLEALTLVLLVPEKRDAILARADDYAHNRLVCGVHYQSDVVASKYTAYAMISVMMNDPQFRKELEAAKVETRRALGL